MPEVWPVSLPQCMIQDGTGGSFGDGRLASQTETGPAKMRRRSSSMPDPLQGSMVMTYAQLTTLSTFVKTTTLGGALPFTFPNQRGGSAVLARFKRDSLPAWQKAGPGRVTVSLELEVLP